MIIHVSEQERVVDNPEHGYRVLSGYFATLDRVDRDKEHFFVLHLDVRNKIKAFELVSVGTLNTSLVHPREVFTRAIGLRSAQLIIAHNHPSGVTRPSEEDLELTKRLVKAGDILGIPIVDHIIFTRDSFTSFQEQRLI